MVASLSYWEREASVKSGELNARVVTTKKLPITIKRRKAFNKGREPIISEKEHTLLILKIITK
jgi:hypothetical protein